MVRRIGIVIIATATLALTALLISGSIVPASLSGHSEIVRASRPEISGTPALHIPFSVKQTAVLSQIVAGSWTSSPSVTLTVNATKETPTTNAEFEVRPITQTFIGAPTETSAVVSGTAHIRLNAIPDGAYHWQARLAVGEQKSAWATVAPNRMSFGVNRQPPSAPVIVSSTNPIQTQTYGSSVISFQWTIYPDPSGIVGYSYRLDTERTTVPKESIRTTVHRLKVSAIPSGDYYFHVRAVDGAGNWGPVATYRVRVDVATPQLSKAIWSGYYFDPDIQVLRLDYMLTKAVHVAVGIYNMSGDRVRHVVEKGIKLANTDQGLSWNGKDDKRHDVPAGSYAIYVRATDRLGNTDVFNWGGMVVTYKRIVVSLAKQKLWAYDHKSLVVSSLVTTGNKDLPTPTGAFNIMFARAPFVFHSPWPQGDPRYYAPSPVSYALYFKDSGYYIHDAPWRSNFGPGSNSQLGTPGQNLTGTHGCVNVPESVMAHIYPWAAPGTAVQITPW